jgi:hypothetical protein
MTTRAQVIDTVRNTAIAELFEAGQSIHRVVNDMFDIASIDMTRHAVELADAIAAIERVKKELVEEQENELRAALNRPAKTNKTED